MVFFKINFYNKILPSKIQSQRETFWLLDIHRRQIFPLSRHAQISNKEPAEGTQSPLLGVYLAFRWFFQA